MDEENAEEKEDAPVSKKLAVSSSPPPSGGDPDLVAASRELSPEQMSRMERNKMEAEARLHARKLGAAAIGPSWMTALLPEMKKNYMEKVVIIKFN